LTEEEVELLHDNAVIATSEIWERGMQQHLPIDEIRATVIVQLVSAKYRSAFGLSIAPPVASGTPSIASQSTVRPSPVQPSQYPSAQLPPQASSGTVYGGSQYGDRVRGLPGRYS
jgi:hypothetical protein